MCACGRERARTLSPAPASLLILSPVLLASLELIFVSSPVQPQGLSKGTVQLTPFSSKVPLAVQGMVQQELELLTVRCGIQPIRSLPCSFLMLACCLLPSFADAAIPLSSCFAFAWAVGAVLAVIRGRSLLCQSLFRCLTLFVAFCSSLFCVAVAGGGPHAARDALLRADARQHGPHPVRQRLVRALLSLDWFAWVPSLCWPTLFVGPAGSGVSL